MKHYLKETNIVNFSDSTVMQLAKAILLAALLRANSIPTAFCYQRLSCSQYEEGVYIVYTVLMLFISKSMDGIE